MNTDLQKISRFWALFWATALFSIIFAVPYQSTMKSHSGRDYASYHYAVQSVLDRESPYDTENLNIRAQEEGTRKEVHPFFYPPPAILSMVWLRPFTLFQGSVAYFWFNQFCLICTLTILARWKKMNWSMLCAGTVLLWPVFDSMKMGQINLFVGLWMLLALRFQSGLALSIAAMTKMSPALWFFAWLVDGRWKRVGMCILGCVGLSLLALVFMPFSEQVHFYVDILPSFSSGAYHGLRVPITIPANHSIPDLLNQLYPGDKDTLLSPLAKQLSGIVTVLLLGILLWCYRLLKNETSKQFMLCSFVSLMLVTPVYCYEHHLALLLVPVLMSLQALQSYSRKVTFIGWTLLAFGGQPLFTLRWLQRSIGMGEWLLQESKFVFILAVGVFCVWEAFKIEREERLSDSFA